MTDTLRQKLTELLEPIVTVTLSESEEGEYPYCTFEMETEPRYAKDMVVRLTGNTSIYIVSKVFSEADGIAAQVAEAIEEGFYSDKYGSSLESYSKDCLEGIWIITLNYKLIQKQ